MSRSVAVIDIGTNSTNLLIVDEAGAQVVRNIASTRLGDELHKSGLLSNDAMNRTIDAVMNHIRTAQSHGVEHISVVGTAACRRAVNVAQFSDMIRTATNVSLEILSEKDEASLAFAGAISGLPEVLAPTLVIDIGGGSTEYTVGVLEAEQSASIPFGALTATASHISRDPAPPEDLTNLIGAVADELEEIGRNISAISSPSRVIGVAGTVLTVAMVELGLAEFDSDVLHGFELTRDAAEDVFRTLATETVKERVLNPGLSSDRADIIVAGCCILVATMRRLHLDAITVSTRGLMDGVATRERLKA